MPPERKNEEKLAKRGKACWLQNQNGVDYGGPLGAGTIKQEEKGVKRKRPVGWGARVGSIT